jgi:hypothetical protein
MGASHLLYANGAVMADTFDLESELAAGAQAPANPAAEALVKPGAEIADHLDANAAGMNA